MGPEDGINLNEVPYFSIEEYIDKIKIQDYVLEHMEESSKNFDKYLTYLSKFDIYAVIYFLIDSLSKEIKFSQAIEKHIIKPDEIKKNNVFFDSLQMSHKRIKDLHQFVTRDNNTSEYRKNPVRVSKMTHQGEIIFWKGCNTEAIKPFMDDFINLYKTTSLRVLDNNPFLKSALMHLIFVRIHPFSDGNGRTARMIHNIKFTESINKVYGTKLKICPLNLSQSILLNQPTYASRINNIYFDLEHDCNDEINRWFDFILNMVDEQLYFINNYIKNNEQTFENISNLQRSDDDISQEIDKMKLKQLSKRKIIV